MDQLKQQKCVLKCWHWTLYMQWSTAGLLSTWFSHNWNRLSPVIEVVSQMLANFACICGASTCQYDECDGLRPLASDRWHSTCQYQWYVCWCVFVHGNILRQLQQYGGRSMKKFYQSCAAGIQLTTGIHIQIGVNTFGTMQDTADASPSKYCWTSNLFPLCKSAAPMLGAAHQQQVNINSFVWRCDELLLMNLSPQQCRVYLCFSPCWQQHLCLAFSRL